ncbi:SMODS domain-containing nucleotidyltransferase [Accumulibacter sp.]|uniref:SMODS domain-containing nucleotidyltransferase n=1 Tax=Accumulibacter sp. TaxID=2053492 RepID=UPI0025840B20|nr:nucleotidyltransferase [Accumulibacter sp.]MDS4055366.1 nucleotidyltransferase [Accumulibacter sp.]
MAQSTSFLGNRNSTMSGLSSLSSPLLSQATGLAALAAPSALTIANLPRWIGVRQRFEQFHRNLGLTPLQQLDGHTKREGVVSCLNRSYHGTTSRTDNSFFIGSWGKDTAIRPPRDVDIYFLLPATVYHRFQTYTWNRQSALLQDVKDKLAVTYPTTGMRGDGQVIVVNFGSYSVEVVPAFELQTPGRYWICDAHNGGSYQETAPWAEVDHIEATDSANARNLRPLIRMLKAWQACCSVPIKSFHLELLAAAFIAQSPWRLKDWFYFDWLTRDFLAFLYHRANSTILVPGTFQTIYLGDAWQSRALSAYNRANKACAHEYENRVAEAGDEWQKIFGTDIPRVA